MYLDKGHSSMSTDSFHAQVEMGMKEKKVVNDETDFVSVINKTGITVQMEASDFIQYGNAVQGKIHEQTAVNWY